MLRPYQKKAVDSALLALRTNRSALIVMPTGTGKTIVAAEIARRMFPRHTIMLAHRRELVMQAKSKMELVTDWPVGVEMADDRLAGGKLPQVVVSSVQTQNAGGDGYGRMSKIDNRLIGLVIADEGHRSLAATFKKVIGYYMDNPHCKLLGITATPDRLDKQAMSQMYDTVAFDYEIADAVNEGWLVPIVQQSIPMPSLNLEHVHTVGGDLNPSELAQVLEDEKNLLPMAQATLEVMFGLPFNFLFDIHPDKWKSALMATGIQRRTLVFNASVAHAEMFSEILNRIVPGCATWICGETPETDRERIFADFASGRVQCLCNCEIAIEGYDNPSIEAVVITRATKSRARYAQMAGRGLRPLDSIAYKLNTMEDEAARRELIAQSSKPALLLVDFAGNAGRHKLVSAMDILGGNISPEVRKIVIRKLSKGKPIKVSVAVDEALEELRKLEARKAAKRSGVIAKTHYTVSTIDPFDAMDIRPTTTVDTSGQRLSPKAELFLRRNKLDPSRYTYTQAMQLLGQINMRYKKGLCSLAQAALLKKRGFPTDVTREEASKIIQGLSDKEGWKKRE